MARKLIVEIIGDASSLEKSLKRAEGRTDTFGSRLKGLGKTGGIAAGVAGLGAIAATLKIGIGEYTQTTKVAAQTEAVIKSTGGSANVTAKHLDDLSEALLKKSGVDDEVIKSGANMLLTFKGIRNETGKGNKIFDQATQTLLDMSVALGTDTRKQAIQLGKALNDPIRGLGALKRVGVTFTDQQIKQVKALTASGKTMEAQKIILRELNTEFGGSAEALGKTLPGQINIVRESFNNWAGELVAKMIPVLTRFGNWVREHWPEIRNTILDAWTAIKPTLVAFRDLVAEVVATFIRHWPQIKPIVLAVAKIIKAQLAVITPALQLLADLLRGDWSKAWGHFKQAAVNAFKALKLIIVTEVKAIVAIVTRLGAELVKLIVRPINFIIDKINAIKIGAVKVAGRTITPAFDPIPNIPRINLGGGGDIVIHNVVELDGQQVAANTTRHQARAQRRTAAQRTGRVAGLGPVVG